MSLRPNIGGAIQKVNNKYELVHAAVKYTEKLMQEDDSSFIRNKRELIKKTFYAINKLAEPNVKVIIKEIPPQTEESQTSDEKLHI